jgi:hypothetical protein
VVYRNRITDEPYPGKERRKLAHPQFFVLVGVQTGGIRIIRLGGIIVF